MNLFRSRTFVVPILLLLLSGCAQNVEQEHPTSADWITYTSEQGGYRVQFPAAPEVSTEIWEAAPGIENPIHTVTCLTEDHVLWIETKQFPAYMVENHEVHLVQQVALIDQGTLHSETTVQLGDHVGREFVYECSIGSRRAFVLQRAFFVRNCLYFICCAKPGSLDEVQVEGKRFIDTFEFLPE